MQERVGKMGVGYQGSHQTTILAGSIAKHTQKRDLHRTRSTKYSLQTSGTSVDTWLDQVLRDIAT